MDVTTQPLRRFLFLGGALAVLAALYPILGFGGFGLVLWTVTFWVVLVAAIHASSYQPRIRRIARTLGGIALIAGVAGLLCIQFLDETHAWIFTGVDILTLAFLTFATGSVLYEVVVTPRIGVNELVGAASAYVLLGLTFTYGYLVTQAFTSSPLLLGEGELCGKVEGVADAQLADYLYYSFVTLTTLGFGDLTPGLLASRVLTGVEAVIGQLFLAVLIARLIGLHVLHATTRAAERRYQ